MLYAINQTEKECNLISLKLLGTLKSSIALLFVDLAVPGQSITELPCTISVKTAIILGDCICFTQLSNSVVDSIGLAVNLKGSHVIDNSVVVSAKILKCH